VYGVGVRVAAVDDVVSLRQCRGRPPEASQHGRRVELERPLLDRAVAFLALDDGVRVWVTPRELFDRADDLDGRVEIEVRARVVRDGGSGDESRREGCECL